MKLLPIIFFLCSVITSFGQDFNNKKTERGQKTGKWIEYNENGNVKQVSFYEPNFQIRNPESVFFLAWDDQADTIQNADTIYYGEKLLWTEKYEYDANDQLSRIIKLTWDQDLIFLYGPGKEIAINKDQFSFNERVSDIKIVTMTIRNESDRVLTLTPEFETNNFSTKQDQLVLPPRKETAFTFQLSIQPNDNQYTVTLKNDSISIDLSVATFGYNLESRNFSVEDELSVKNSFIYWRTGDEALLRLYDNEKKNILKTFSLAHERSIFDLTGVQPGDYMLCKRDFSTDQQACCKLKVEN